MAQFIKEEIKLRLLEAAREEFLDKGFEGASVRTITSKARTAKSNLYNYFKDKDELFCAVLEPTLLEILAGLEEAQQFGGHEGTRTYTLAAQRQVVDAVIGFIAQHEADVRLLLFSAQGSSLSNSRREVLDAFTDVMVGWARAVRPREKVSRPFVSTVCGFYLNVIEQLLLSGRPADWGKYMDEVVAFIYGGWKNVLSGPDGI